MGISVRRGLLLLVALALGCRSHREDSGDAGAPSNKQLRAELLAMGDADEAWMEDSLAAKPDWKKLQTDHLARIQRLKEIIRQYGWPTVTLVGADGASAAWITVQHADDDPAFQMSCVPLIEAAAASGEAQLSHMACLTDRALSGAGSPQLYGTQGLGGPIAGRPAVNERRRAVGLPSLEEYWRGLQLGTAKTTCRR